MGKLVPNIAEKLMDSGQDPGPYLAGLRYNDCLTNWDINPGCTTKPSKERGATDQRKVEKPLCSKQLKHKYSGKFLILANKLRDNTLYDKCQRLSKEKRSNKKLIGTLRSLDVAVNVNWLLIHIGAAHKF